MRLGESVISLKLDPSSRWRSVETDKGSTVSGEVLVLAMGVPVKPGLSLGPEIRAWRGQVVRARQEDPWLANMVYVDGLDIIRRSDGEVLIGAMRERGADERIATVTGISSLLERLTRHLAVPPTLIFSGAQVGLRPEAREALPFCGELPNVQGVFVINGLFRNGNILGPVLGKRLAQAIESM